MLLAALTTHNHHYYYYYYYYHYYYHYFSPVLIIGIIPYYCIVHGPSHPFTWLSESIRPQLNCNGKEVDKQGVSVMEEGGGVAVVDYYDDDL